MMFRRLFTFFVVMFSLFGIGLAQENDCNQAALDGIAAAQAEHSDDVRALFDAIDSIEAEWQSCATGEGAEAENAAQAEMSASEIVDEGNISEGLWAFTVEYTLSDACEERKKTDTHEFFEDVYYNEDGLLVWDAGNNFSNYVVEYLLARRYIRSDSGHNWVYEYEIESATETTMSGMYAGYWQGNRNIWCSREGVFSAELYESDNSCLVSGEANIRTKPSTKSPTNGKIEDQRRAIGKVKGDDGYFWWQLSDDEFVREDVVGSSRACGEL